jgi:hypothetical protein
MNWLKAHPFQAVSFAVYFTAVATFAGFLPHLWVPFLVLFLLGLGVFVAIFQIYCE